MIMVKRKGNLHQDDIAPPISSVNNVTAMIEK